MLHDAKSFRHTRRNNRTSDHRAVGVPALNPVVIRDAGVGRIDITHPNDRTAAGKREHAFVVVVGGVDTPLLVGRHEVQNDGLVAVVCDIAITGERSLVSRGSVLSELLTECSHPSVVLVELLAAGNRAPRQKQVLILPESDIRDFIVFRTGPVRSTEGLSRAMCQIIEGDLVGNVSFGEEAGIYAALVFHKRPASEGQSTVGFGRDAKDEVGGVDIRFHLRTAFGYTFLHRAV